MDAELLEVVPVSGLVVVDDASELELPLVLSEELLLVDVLSELVDGIWATHQKAL